MNSMQLAIRKMNLATVRKCVIVAVFGGIIVFPLLLLIVQSFAFRWGFGQILPKTVSLRGWQVLMQEPALLNAMISTLLIAVIVVAVNLLIAIPAAKALAYETFKGKALIDTILFMPIVVPALAIAMGIHLTMIRIGLAGTLWGVILVHLIPTVPYTIRILRSGFEGMGKKWLEQAKTLGATPLRSYWTVAVPQLLPSIRAAIFLVFLISLSQYALTVIISGGSVITLAMIYYPYLATVDDAVIASFSLLFAIVPILFLIVIEGMIRLLVPYQRKFSLRNMYQGVYGEGGDGNVRDMS